MIRADSIAWVRAITIRWRATFQPPFTLKNTFTNNIESVRAVVFLLDDQGKMAGQAAHWIIGGANDKPGLASDQKTTYNFVVTTDKPFTKAKVMVSRLIMENGKLGDPIKDVQILQTQ